MDNMKMDFTEVPRVSNFKLVLIILGIPIAVLPIWLLMRTAPNMYNFTSNYTMGLITPTLITYLIMYLVFIYFMLIKGSNYSLKQLGLNRSKLQVGIVFTLILFIVLQVYGAIYSFISTGKLVLNQGMREWTVVAGIYIQLIFGVAFFEEIVYRSFLIPQIFMRMDGGSKKNRMFLTLVISQALFSLVHIPINLTKGVNIGLLAVNLSGIFFIGMVFAFLYLLTENIFICMGVHAVWDAAMVNAITIFSSKYAFIVVALFVFIAMYINAAGKKNKRAVEL